MRLSWPFRLFQRAPAPESTEPAASTRAESETRKRDDWRRLPALAETIGPPPLIAPTAPFAADLGAGNPPPPILAPLAHARGLEAPAGVVLGLARPVQRAADSGPLPPLQRRPAGRRASQVPDASTMDPSSAEPAAPPLGPTPEAPAADESVTLPRRLAVAAQVQRARVTLSRLSQSDRGALPLRSGIVGQAVTAGGPALAPAASSPMPSPPASPAVKQLATIERDRALPLPSPISRKPAGGSSAEPASFPIAGRLTLGQSRRLGLGSPMAALPTTATPVAGSERPTSLPLSAGAPVQRKPDSAQTAGTRVDDKAVPVSAAPATSGPVVGRAMPAVSARPTQTPTAPLISARPLRTSVQRAPLTASRTRARHEGNRDDEPSPNRSPVKVHRGSVVSELAESLDAKAFTHQGEIYLPSRAGPMGSPTARSLIAHEMTHVAQQRAYGSRLPQEHTAHGQDLERKAAAAENHAELPLAQPTNRLDATSQSASDEMASQAQRKRTDASHAPAATVDTTTIAFPGQIQRAQTGRPTTSSTEFAPDPRDHKKTDSELEELAGQLYGRISRRLRRELLVERERAGLMVDLP